MRPGLSAVVVIGVAAVVCALPNARLARELVAPPELQPHGPAKPVLLNRPTRLPNPGVRPVGLEIPAIGVRARIVPVPVAHDGDQAVPSGLTVAGWSTATSVPGAPGPAVVLGHVDGPTGPAVFARLPEVPLGARVDVGLSDGTHVRFVVRRVTRVTKAAAPAVVYGPAVAGELRLVTCGGVFDRSTGHYLDNVVVVADLSG